MKLKFFWQDNHHNLNKKTHLFTPTTSITETFFCRQPQNWNMQIYPPPAELKLVLDQIHPPPQELKLVFIANLPVQNRTEYIVFKLV